MMFPVEDHSVQDRTAETIRLCNSFFYNEIGWELYTRFLYDMVDQIDKNHSMGILFMPDPILPLKA